MTETIVTLPGTDLASRKTAAAVRHNVINAITYDNRVIIDLSTVVTVSYSYADELFGVLAAVKGWDWITKNVRLQGANEHVLRVVAEAINRRLKETGQPVKRSA